MTTRSRTERRLVVVTCVVTLLHAGVASSQSAAAPATKNDSGRWHALLVTGGRHALDSLGIAPTFDRAMTMTELVRRLHFSAQSPAKLQAAALTLKLAVADLQILQDAIARATDGGKAPSLALVGQRGGRKRFEAVVEAAGLELREQQRQFTIVVAGGERSTALRDRLATLGLNVEAMQPRLAAGGDVTLAVPTVELPLPLAPELWSRMVFEREVAPGELFTEIINDPNARLLYHGLVALDADTRRWIGTQSDLLRRLYRDDEMARAFAVFGAAIRVSGGSVAVPGGAVGARRWRGLLDTDVTNPELFVRRLFDAERGRIAGLYFTVSAVEEPRQRFILDMVNRPQDVDGRIKRLASSFANCYPSNSTAYPFVLRSHDAAVLLAEVGLTPTGLLAGPAWSRFWSLALSGDHLPDNPAEALRGFKEQGLIDAAGMVDALCSASPTDRAAVFTAFLFGHRAFISLPEAELPDALVAVRARRLYPAVMMAVEQAGVRTSRTYAAVARHAERIASIDDPVRAIVATRQFQGVLALTVGAIAADTLTVENGARLMESLASLRFDEGQYGGQIARWLATEWLPAVRQRVTTAAEPAATSVERLVIDAWAGPSPGPGRTIEWEGRQYVLDPAAAIRARLSAVRKRQGGVTLDQVLNLDRLRTQLQQSTITLEQVVRLRSELRALAPLLVAPAADEFGDQALDVSDRIGRVLRDLTAIDRANEVTRAADAARDLDIVIDVVLGQALASWAYAPHVGDPDGPMMVGGDPSLRHSFGVRLAAPGRARKRWEVALHPGEGGVVTGALIGLEASLARWSLRRLASDAIPEVPTIIGNDLLSFFLSAALSNPRRLTDDDRDAIARAYRTGTAVVEQAGTDPTALDAAAASGAVSPWSRQALSWMVTKEPDQIVEKFSALERIRIGGLRALSADAWGTASLLSGCLCIRMPPARVPELVIGRAADGLIASQSADLMLRLAVILAELNLPAPLAAPVMAYAMSDFLDHVSPSHAADFDAFTRQARALDRRVVEDYLGAIAAVGPLRVAPERQ